MVVCPNCGREMRRSNVQLDASASGFTLVLSGVPVTGCSHCATPLQMGETPGTTLDDLVAAAMDALESLAGKGMGEPRGIAMHCRQCGTQLPARVDNSRARFAAGAPLGPGMPTIGVEYLGPSVSCTRCYTKHPYMPATFYHQMRDAISRSIRFYVRH